ncbi:MAG: hypothetical protein IH845_02140 [Nanoarchaeota archaeon]|nr:hypothetical protein [Nanoarchaeota archaeon]
MKKNNRDKKKGLEKKEIFGNDLNIYTCDVNSNNVFYCANGDSFKNIMDLGNSLDLMDDETFAHHVNFEKNDFATWVYDVIGDVELANTLRELENLEDTKREVRIRIKFLGGN